jgi:hypothetical protein
MFSEILLYTTLNTHFIQGHVCHFVNRKEGQFCQKNTTQSSFYERELMAGEDRESWLPEWIERHRLR